MDILVSIPSFTCFPPSPSWDEGPQTETVMGGRERSWSRQRGVCRLEHHPNRGLGLGHSVRAWNWACRGWHSCLGWWIWPLPPPRSTQWRLCQVWMRSCLVLFSLAFLETIDFHLYFALPFLEALSDIRVMPGSACPWSKAFHLRGSLSTLDTYPQPLGHVSGEVHKSDIFIPSLVCQRGSLAQCLLKDNLYPWEATTFIGSPFPPLQKLGCYVPRWTMWQVTGKFLCKELWNSWAPSHPGTDGNEVSVSLLNSECSSCGMRVLTVLRWSLLYEEIFWRVCNSAFRKKLLCNSF